MKVPVRPVRLMAIGAMPALLMAWPGPAAAHLVQTGFGSFYDGAAHVLLSPEDLLLLLALGLLAGLRGRAVARSMVLALPFAWACGLLIGYQEPVGSDYAKLSFISYGVIGILVAVNLDLSHCTVTSLAILFGLLQGYISGAALSLPEIVLSMAGMLSAVMTLALLLCAALVASLRRQWARIAARAAGSWLAALSMLMVGWMARN